MRPSRPTAVFVVEVAVFAVAIVLGWLSLFRAVFTPARIQPRRVAPSVAGAEVALSSAAAEKLLSEMGTFMHASSGGGGGGPVGELDPFDLEAILPPHLPLAFTPPAWRPLTLPPPPEPLPELLPQGARAPTVQDYPGVVSGFFVQVSEDLKEAGFSFAAPSLDALGVAEGESKFSVEVDAEGRVEGIWRLKTEAGAVPALEQAIRRGRATRSCRGEVWVGWSR